MLDTDHVLIRETTILLKYTSSFRPPSGPRDSRCSRSRSHSTTRNKVITVQTQPTNDPLQFEVQMYQPTEMAKSFTPISWFYSFFFTYFIKTQKN